jgi:hypothetical protein
LTVAFSSPADAVGLRVNDAMLAADGMHFQPRDVFSTLLIACRPGGGVSPFCAQVSALRIEPKPAF